MWDTTRLIGKDLHEQHQDLAELGHAIDFASREGSDYAPGTWEELKDWWRSLLNRHRDREDVSADIRQLWDELYRMAL